MMQDAPPRWPSKGHRRELDQKWLSYLESRGVAAFNGLSNADAPTQLYQGVEQFNGSFFWECHETLEDIWQQTSYPTRTFYHGLILVAAGFHHLSRQNRRGAQSKLTAAVRILQLLPPTMSGVRIDLLLTDVAAWLVQLEASEAVNWSQVDAMPRPCIRLMDQVQAPPIA